MMPAKEIIIFDDCEKNHLPALRDLVHDQENAIVQQFLRQSGKMLREEVGRQPKWIQDQIPSFATIIEFIERCHDGSNAFGDYALHCMYQIGSLLANHDASLWLSSKPVTHCTAAFGLGILAGSAVTVSRTTAELAEVGAHFVVLALRVAIHVYQTARFLIPTNVHGKSGFDILVIEGVTEQHIEGILLKSEPSQIRSTNIYVSRVFSTKVIVSGPSELLSKFVTHAELQHHTISQRAVPGPLGAPSIYGSDDVIDILAGWRYQKTFKKHSMKMAMCTSSSWALSDNVYELLAQNLLRLLTEKSTFSELCTAAASLESPTRTLLTFGSHNDFKELVSALNPKDSKDILRRNTRIPEFHTENPSKIAIVGYSGRFPGAADAELLWQLLKDGRDVHRKVPAERFNIETHFDPTAKKTNTMQTEYGCFVDDPGLFDSRFFSVSPREAAQMDPVQRLTLITAYEALEMAGFVAGRTPSSRNYRVGTFYGQASDDWRETNSSQNIDTYFIPCGIRAFTPGRVNYHFKFSGPSYSVDTACSSSFAALQIACTSLASGECDTAVAGGGNILTNPDIFAGLSRGHFLSTTGQCKTFDDGADGYCRADGVSSLILKRLEDARNDNDNIFGVILGTKTNHSAEAVSITRPDHSAQAFLCRSIMEEAGVNPLDVEYVEMHGTGTQAGDYHEVLSVSDVFASKTGAPRSKPLYIGAVKANIGHGEAAAGVMSLVKVLKMLQHNSIPPHVGIKSGIRNKRLPSNLDSMNIRIPMNLQYWPPHTDGSRRIVFLNNFSAAGGNTAMLLEEGPTKPQPVINDSRNTFVISLSAKSASSLKANIKNLAAYLASNPSISLGDLSYTTTARRMVHNYRFAFPTNDIKMAQKILESIELPNAPSIPKKVIFVFTGQGGMYTSLGRTLFETSTQFRSHLLISEKLAIKQGFSSFIPLINGPMSDASSLSPLVLQLGAVCVQMALADLFASFGVKPSAVIGHSLGEYAAMYAAGILSAKDVIFMVGSRAQLLEKYCQTGSHAMLAVKLPASSLAPRLDNCDASISCLNGPMDSVVGGAKATIDFLIHDLKADAIKYTKLAVTHAFHSSQMDPILEDLTYIAKSVNFTSPRIPYISSLLRRVATIGDLNEEYIVRQTREKVDFFGAVLAAQTDNLFSDKTVWLEIGHQPLCTGMLRSILGSDLKAVSSLRKQEDPWSTIAASLAALFNEGESIQWNEYHRDFENGHTLLTLPAFAFDLKNYWIDYRNDWSLTKGQADSLSAIAADSPFIQPPKRLSLTVQEILEEVIGDGVFRILAQTDVSNPKLRELIFGHVVNGVGLCPSVIWADMALVISRYMFQQTTGSSPQGIDVRTMEVDKPLILYTDASRKQLVQVSATMKDGQVKFQFYSLASNGKRTSHAVCDVKFGNSRKWSDKWNRNSYLIRDQIKRLKYPVDNIGVHRIGRGMVYKLFSALVDYNQSYRAMDEVNMDAAAFEATARVTFKSPKSDKDDYYMNPRWVDNLCHISGFIVNASEETRSEDQVYISHGWSSMRFAEEFSETKTYCTYAKMQLSGQGGVRQGDVYVLEREKIVAVFGGVKFQCVPKKLLSHLLPPDSKSSKPTSEQITATSKHNAAQKNTSSAKPVLSSSTTAPSVPKKLTRPPAKENEISAISIRALRIVSAECGVSLDELKGDTLFVDFGIDSLLALTILARFREELNIEVDSSLFIDNPTVSDLKRALDGTSAPGSETIDDEDSGYHSSPGPPAPLVIKTLTNETEIMSADSPQESLTVRTIIAAQIGIQIDELTDDADLAAMGLDSLMSLSITAEIREQMELEIPDDLLSSNRTILELEQSLGITRIAPTPTEVNIPSASAKSVASKDRPKALSFLIQGNPRTAKEVLFFFPDGSGSATSYAPIPPIGKDICVYSLNCPYMKIPEHFHCGIDGVSSIYLDEVKRRQPKGPYNFGGWSAGGVMAFEAALQLIQRGETVSRLVLIDSPCPIKLEPVPTKLFKFFDSIGVLGDRNHTMNSRPSPPYLIPHFDAMIRNLDTYVARPFPKGTKCKVLAIWARDGVCKNPDDPVPLKEPGDPKVMDWLLNNRTDFGPNGWDQLIPEDSFTNVSMQGNHFSMIIDPHVKELGRAISDNF